MKKRILFCINALGIGGSERSLVSLLNLLDYSRFDVDLMMLKKGEDFEQFIPKNVNILSVPKYYDYLDNPVSYRKQRYKYLYTRYKTSFLLRLNNVRKNPVNCEQILYCSQKNVLNNIKKEYDIAIAYAQGYPTYFVMDKVNAKKKIAWINCDYVSSKYNKAYDYEYYKNYHHIVAVSHTIKDSILRADSRYKDKLSVVLDIINPNIVNHLAKQYIPEKFDNVINILTVGRLVVHHKGYDIAVEAAKLLKDYGIKFKWTIVGEGPDRIQIQKLIDKNNLSNDVLLIGKKVNPYPYMENCDIYVQPSRKEGLGLTVVEAKILKKPIICTNFNTARELINSEVDGLIVDNTAESLFIGLRRCIEDQELINYITNHLNQNESISTIEEIQKINNLLLG